ncbi:MAG: glycosyltransferase [Rhodopirellula sp.]|nr:glycosyltransferase [Rhodopirellula sp.]
MDATLSRQAAIAHPWLKAGGSEAAVLRGLSLLGRTQNVTFLTGGDVELDRLNQHCGTSLDSGDFRVLRPSRLAWRSIGRTDALRGAVFQRFCQSVAAQFDVLISCYNLLDFGRPAIQFIADLSFDEGLRRMYAPPPYGMWNWAYRPSPLRRAYLALARRIAGRSAYDGRQDMVVANSRWMADVLSSKRGINAQRVVYPPVVGDAPAVPWNRKEVGFTVLGRIAPEKRIERVIEILSRVRSLGHDVHLHVIGATGSDAYGRSIRGTIDENRDWVFSEGRLDGERKMALLAAHRYAIHGCVAEAFGIAVAEMVKAGCIPFVPDDGGQVEIVGDGRLCYRDVDDAVSKIDRVLRCEEIQRSLTEHLRRQGELFSAERFMSEFRNVVEEFWHTRQDAISAAARA